MRGSGRIHWRALAVLLPILAGCAAPLGPGFHFISRQAAFNPIEATPVRVHVRLTDQLTNAGNRSLTYLDVAPPNASGEARLNVLVDGRPAQAAPVSAEPGAALRIRFDPPWPLLQQRSFAFDYDLSSAPYGADVAAAPAAFHLDGFDALPHWLPPPGVFVTADSRARRDEFGVTVPSGFRVLAAGRALRAGQQGSLTTHRYRLGPEDHGLFVVAGLYQETRVHAHHGEVIFWTLNTLDTQAARGAAERLADSAATYRQAFGPASKGSRPLRIVEMPASSASASASASEDDAEQFPAASFPSGAILDQRAFAKGVADDAFLEQAEYELARTWFGWLARPSAESEILMGRGAGLFAVVIAAEARGGASAREQAVRRLFAAYDRARAQTPDAALLAPPDAMTPAQRAVNGYKAALFWVALADIAGKDASQRAARRIVQSLAGGDITEPDLRAALEAETGHDLAGVFRAWLDHPGIPSDFRARYAAAP